jgi:WS/DGAT/MGAT family acyltransferase
VKKIPLGLQDAQMLLGDSPETPMHVGGFNVYRRPERAPPDFVRRVVQQLRGQAIASPPWNYRLVRQSGLASKLTPAWEIVTNEDIDYHLAHHALPAPGGERELGELLSRMHSQPLDMTRPLWEWHVIEGFGDGRFVIYQKVHHALFDGSTGMRAFSAMNSESPDAPLRAPWAESGSEPAPQRRTANLRDRLSNFGSRLRKSQEFYWSVPGLIRAAGRTVQAAMGDASGLVAPYSGPPCIVNGKVTRRRRIATQALEFGRVKALSKTVDCTVNDVMLALCGAALRRYLGELNALPKMRLTAGIPVGLKHEAGAKSGNNVSLIFTTLGTDHEDPLERLMAVRTSTRAAKDHLTQLTDASRDTYSLIMLLPALVGGALGGGRGVCNVPVSNVPGPRTRLYLAGAALEAAYPTSVLAGNVALGITFVSYDQGLFVGIVFCPDVLPHGQRLGPYIGDALIELEDAVARKPASHPVDGASAPSRAPAQPTGGSRSRRGVVRGNVKRTGKAKQRPAERSKTRSAGAAPGGRRGQVRRRSASARKRRD